MDRQTDVIRTQWDIIKLEEQNKTKQKRGKKVHKLNRQRERKREELGRKNNNN